MGGCDATKKSTRDKRGRFIPGVSGNPLGMKPGTNRTAEFRASIAEHVPAIIKTLVNAAMGGDVAAARVLLERAIPAYRAEGRHVELPEVLSATTLGDQAKAVIRSVASGSLLPAEGAEVLGAVKAASELEKYDQLEQTLDQLENRHGVRR